MAVQGRGPKKWMLREETFFLSFSKGMPDREMDGKATFSTFSPDSGMVYAKETA